jgi:hypothetical protein
MGVLLYLVSREKMYYAILVLLFLLYIGLTVSNIRLALEMGDLQFQNMANALLLALLYILVGGLFIKRVELRQNGIRDFLFFVKWEDIESYSWTGLAQQNLSVKFKNPKILKIRSFAIPLKDAEMVNRIMAEKVLDWREQPAL